MEAMKHILFVIQLLFLWVFTGSAVPFSQVETGFQSSGTLFFNSQHLIEFPNIIDSSNINNALYKAVFGISGDEGLLPVNDNHSCVMSDSVIVIQVLSSQSTVLTPASGYVWFHTKDKTEIVINELTDPELLCVTTETVQSNNCTCLLITPDKSIHPVIKMDDIDSGLSPRSEKDQIPIQIDDNQVSWRTGRLLKIFRDQALILDNSDQSMLARVEMPDEGDYWPDFDNTVVLFQFDHSDFKQYWFNELAISREVSSLERRFMRVMQYGWFIRIKKQNGDVVYVFLNSAGKWVEISERMLRWLMSLVFESWIDVLINGELLGPGGGYHVITYVLNGKARKTPLDVLDKPSSAESSQTPENEQPTPSSEFKNLEKEVISEEAESTSGNTQSTVNIGCYDQKTESTEKELEAPLCTPETTERASEKWPEYQEGINRYVSTLMWHGYENKKVNDSWFLEAKATRLLRNIPVNDPDNVRQRCEYFQSLVETNKVIRASLDYFYRNVSPMNEKLFLRWHGALTSLAQAMPSEDALDRLLQSDAGLIEFKDAYEPAASQMIKVKGILNFWPDTDQRRIAMGALERCFVPATLSQQIRMRIVQDIFSPHSLYTSGSTIGSETVIDDLPSFLEPVEVYNHSGYGNCFFDSVGSQVNKLASDVRELMHNKQVELLEADDILADADKRLSPEYGWVIIDELKKQIDQELILKSVENGGELGSTEHLPLVSIAFGVPVICYVSSRKRFIVYNAQGMPVSLAEVEGIPGTIWLLHNNFHWQALKLVGSFPQDNLSSEASGNSDESEGTDEFEEAGEFGKHDDLDPFVMPDL